MPLSDSGLRSHQVFPPPESLLDFAAPDRIEQYKFVDDGRTDDLNLHVFEPTEHQPGALRPAALWLYGGVWTNNPNPAAFYEQSRWLASRGMVAFAPEFRGVVQSQGYTPTHGATDVRSAIRYIRSNAHALGVDPERIIIGGGSSGGHLAATVAMIDDFDDPLDDLSISVEVEAQILFNPATMLEDAAEREFFVDDFPSYAATLANRFDGDRTPASPYHHVASGQAATMVLHATGDNSIPFVTSQHFVDQMQAAGNVAQLQTYNNLFHGFFHYVDAPQREGGRSNELFYDTMTRVDSFLVELGLLDAPQLTGDFDGDHDVDLDDYLTWRQTFGSITQLAADGNGDGIVNALDYAIWRESFETASLATPVTLNTPEPATSHLILLMLFLARPRASRY